jgi:hypothetical protein
MGNKVSSQPSSEASSKLMQAYVHYRIKDKGKFMSAEQLLATQLIKNKNNQHINNGDGDADDDGYDDGDESLVLQDTDIIEFKTEGFSHWGIYIGCNCVAHLEDGYIRQSKVVNVAAGKKCRINNKLMSATNRKLEALPHERVMQIVNSQLDKPVKHSPVQYNSEHQVTEFKYGQAFSDTVDILMGDCGRAIGGATGGAVGFMTGGVSGTAAGSVTGSQIGKNVAKFVSNE